MLSKALERSYSTKAVTSLLSMALSTVSAITLFNVSAKSNCHSDVERNVSFLPYIQLIVLKQHVHMPWKELAAMIWDDYCLPPHDPHPLKVG